MIKIKFNLIQFYIMCGIFGLIINKKNYPYEKFNNLTNKLFILSEERGKDAAGIFFNHKTKFKALKKY